jgi:16S rRNA (cytosine1402-N4)-methyltransferase
MNYTSHYSVLKKECLDHLCSSVDNLPGTHFFADLTFGGGGHSFEFLYRNKNFKVVSTDQDPDALKNGYNRIESEGMSNRITLLNTNFVNFPEIIKAKMPEIFENQNGFQGILLDLGVSSHHFDDGSRGFSFRFDAPLDMRMNYESDEFLTAEEIVNSYSENDLVKIFWEYGEEKYSKKIAAKIIETRKTTPIKTTKDLENIIFHCYPKDLRHGKTNPSTRVFQAIRLEVNQELKVLTEVISQLVPLLKMGGKLAIISFHSLEDRIVKNIFKEFSVSESIPVEIITKKPIIPSSEEILNNSRSRSAKLRVIERIESRKEKNKYKQK